MDNAREYSSLPSRVDTPEKSPAPAPALTGKRVSSGSNVTVMQTDFVRMGEILVKKAALIHEQSLQIENQAMEINLMEKSVKERALELEKKEQRFGKVEERERKVKLSEKSIEESKQKLSLESNAARFVLEKEKKELETKKKELEAKGKWIEKKRKTAEQVEKSVKELAEKERSFEETIKEKQSELDAKAKALKEKANEIETTEEILETKENELMEKEALLKEKEVEMKEEILKAKASENEWRSKYLDLREREFEAGRSILQGESSKRSRLKLVTEKSSEFNFSISPAKGQRPLENSVRKASACASSSRFITQPHKREEVVAKPKVEGGVVSLDDDESEEEEEEEPEPMTIPESEFNDFSKTMDCFKKGEVWGLYDRVDEMPRLYGQIMKINKSRSVVEVRWVNPRAEEGDSVCPVACGRFDFGTKQEQELLAFSHKMHCVKQGKYLIKMYPKQGETWALFRDWSNDASQQLNPPYSYEFVEVLSDFEDVQGVVEVAYLEKVQGFVSIFKRRRNGLSRVTELHRFSHRVPSFKMKGDEKEGVLASSFELDPAALPSSLLQPDHQSEPATETACKVEEQSGSRNDHPIIILD